MSPSGFQVPSFHLTLKMDCQLSKGSGIPVGQIFGTFKKPL